MWCFENRFGQVVDVDEGFEKKGGVKVQFLLNMFFNMIGLKILNFKFIVEFVLKLFFVVCLLRFNLKYLGKVRVNYINIFIFL